MNQNATPILDAIEKFHKTEPAFFRIPAHRFERGADPRALEVLGEKAYQSDLTEAEGLDDLHDPKGPILEAEKLAASLYGSRRCWFLVNGTTCGNEAMVLSAVKPGEKILVPRNAHKSILMGLILSGAEPVWMMPRYVQEFGIYGDLSLSVLDDAWHRNPDARAAFVVSPTYYGITSRIDELAETCHRYQIPLLVDEAHGAHFSFGNMPKSAIRQGADLVSQSTHKTAGSFTQSSILHFNSSFISEDRVDENLKLVMSTSPNYLLMASLDGARHAFAMHGTSMMERASKLANMAREGLGRILCVRVLDAVDTKAVLDPLRVTFSARDAGITGYALQEKLYDEFGVSCELADFENVVAVITWANTEDDISRLINAVHTIVSRVWKSGKMARLTAGNFRLPELPPVILTPRKAWYANRRTVAWKDAVGRIAGESVIPYPPGIPLLCPGERVTKEIFEAIEQFRKAGLPIHGPASRDLTEFKVIDE